MTTPDPQQIETSRNALRRARAAEQQAIQQVEDLESGLGGVFSWLIGGRTEALEAATTKAEQAIAARKAAEAALKALEAQVGPAAPVAPAPSASPPRMRPGAGMVTSPTQLQAMLPQARRTLQALTDLEHALRNGTPPPWSPASLALQDLLVVAPGTGIASLPPRDAPDALERVSRVRADLEVLVGMHEVEAAQVAERARQVPPELVQRALHALHAYQLHLTAALADTRSSGSAIGFLQSRRYKQMEAADRRVRAANAHAELNTLMLEPQGLVNRLQQWLPELAAYDLGVPSPELADFLMVQQRNVTQLVTYLEAVRTAAEVPR
ncbi:MAG: hypothetical protein KC656_08165 [Myxococcales bacterium]|nr:hypothetical protein [Myxococcales bacterium]